MLTDFAQQAGLALLAGRSQRDRSLMAMLDDRDRIARDMHDHVIQRLFATGLSLQSAAHMASHLTLQPRVDAAVDDIDAAIKEICQAIYQLHRPVRSDEMSDRLKALTASFTQHLGFAPRLKTFVRWTDWDRHWCRKCWPSCARDWPMRPNSRAPQGLMSASPWTTSPSASWSWTTARASTRPWPRAVWSTSRNARPRATGPSSSFRARRAGPCCGGASRGDTTCRDVGPSRARKSWLTLELIVRRVDVS